MPPLENINAPMPNERLKIIISDCHLSAGRYFEGHINPHEDFYFDDEMADFFDYFSTGEFGTRSDGTPVEMELIINGDFFDYLNVPYQGEFETSITEAISLFKTEAIIKGHPTVMQAIRRFAARPGKKVTYLVGNHDADLLFPKVRERITREWDPNGRFPSKSVKVIADVDRITYPEGVEIHHGNQFEAIHVLNFKQPLLTDYLDEPILNLPWGSFYVLKIINRFRWERDYIDKIRPIKVFILFGIVLDPWFTIRFAFLSMMYFVFTRFVYSPTRRSRLSVTAEIVKQEMNLFKDLDRPARRLLDQDPKLKTVIFGHTHYPMNKIYADGRQYINTGTWTKMLNLDWKGLGQQIRLTFALVRLREDGTAYCDLHQWVGEHKPHRVFNA